mgnify:FL=1
MINIFFYINELTEIQKLNLHKLKKISIIYRNYEKKNYIKNAFRIAAICKRLKFKFYISNDYKLATLIGANGIYIPSFNNIMIKPYKKIEIIGSAHNVQEIQKKIMQGCNKIFLSPLFPTKDYQKSKILGIHKFNSIRRLFSNKTKIYALGGINEINLRKLILHNIEGMGSISILEKKIDNKFLNTLNLIAQKP